MFKIEELKSLVPAKYDLEELIVLSAAAMALKTEYARYGEEAPRWLDNACVLIPSEIHGRARDAKLRKLSAARTQLAALATPAERRDSLEQQINELESSLEAAS